MDKSSATFDHKSKRDAEISRRYLHHNSLRNLADEFDMSKSQVHRIINET